MVLLRDACAKTCPENYFQRNLLKGSPDGSRASASLGICTPCHYSCRTCSSPNEHECLSCYGGSTLHESRCYSTQLLNSIESNHFWYTAFLTIVVVLTIVLLLLLYVCFRRQGGSSGNGLDRRTYRRVPISNDEDSPLEIDIVDIRYSMPPPPPSHDHEPSATDIQKASSSQNQGSDLLS